VGQLEEYLTRNDEALAITRTREISLGKQITGKLRGNARGENIRHSMNR
jgi:hypothetical protein